MMSMMMMMTMAMAMKTTSSTTQTSSHPSVLYTFILDLLFVVFNEMILDDN